MAYSDYGGYAYRNGARVEERSDAVLSPDGIKSTPGAWPGWTLPEGHGGHSQHVLLGDGPIFVGLYKQGHITVYRLGDEIDSFGAFENGYDSKREAHTVDWDGWRLEVRWTEEDNRYCYAQLIQPDGTVWTGFSGYGVGAGLEDCGYGYSTREREDVLIETFSPTTVASHNLVCGNGKGAATGQVKP